MTIIVIVLAAIAIGYSFYKKHVLAYEEKRFNEELAKEEMRREELEKARHERELKQVQLQTAYIDKEMEEIEKKQNQITFKTEVEESLANAIRRYLNQIPVLAIDELEIIKNGSALYDEVVAHRVGLIPLKMGKGVNEKTKGALKLSAKKEGFHSQTLKQRNAVIPL